MDFDLRDVKIYLMMSKLKRNLTLFIDTELHTPTWPHQKVESTRMTAFAFSSESVNILKRLTFLCTTGSFLSCKSNIFSSGFHLKKKILFYGECNLIADGEQSQCIPVIL